LACRCFSSAILAGAGSGDLATVLLLLDKGADVNFAPNS
jgi:hypothetical protein